MNLETQLPQQDNYEQYTLRALIVVFYGLYLSIHALTYKSDQ